MVAVLLARLALGMRRVNPHFAYRRYLFCGLEGDCHEKNGVSFRVFSKSGPLYVGYGENWGSNAETVLVLSATFGEKLYFD